jgi:hypothetical protein
MATCLGQANVETTVSPLPAGAQLSRQVASVLALDPGYAGHSVAFVSLVLGPSTSTAVGQAIPGGSDVVSALPPSQVGMAAVVVGLSGFDIQHSVAPNSPAARDPALAAASDLHRWAIVTDAITGAVQLQVGCP